ncbi:MAG: hypothetical protein VYE18_06645 [Pseudomonadota bacterium]|nr:hypothetical protein [Pseudomonadota bacterium]
MTRLYDLENGYLILGSGEDINWQTSVECILSRTSEHNEKQHAWLSNECRAEAPSPDIFGFDRNYEHVVVKGWDKNVCVRGGSYNYGFNPIKNFLGKVPETAHEISDCDVKVYCKLRNVKALSFDEALEFFQKNDETKSNKIYMLVEYETGSRKYKLIAPCRLTNFTNSLNNKKFLQPISGFVLFECGERFHIAYVAAHIREAGTKSVEFRVREMTSFVNTKNKDSRLYPVFKLLDFLFLRFFFVMDEFTRVEKVHNSKCTLFVYDD